jgi:hypothetical protein
VNNTTALYECHSVAAVKEFVDMELECQPRLPLPSYPSYHPFSFLWYPYVRLLQLVLPGDYSSIVERRHMCLTKHEGINEYR